MSSQYRVEVSPNNRATCKDSVCKKNGVKLTKGEIRFGSWFSIDGEHGSWAWKHWGCVSGAQLTNIQEACRQDDGSFDFDMIDGYDEINDHPEFQAKIRKAVEQGHVALEDFNGDPEKCKPGMKGIRLTDAQRAKIEREAADASDDDEDAPPKKTKAKGKRARGKAADQEEADSEQPKAKRSKKAKKPAKAISEDDEEAPSKPAHGRGASRTQTKTETDEEAEEEVPPPKKSRKSLGKKAKEESDDEQPPAPATKKGRRSASAAKVKHDADEDENPEPKPTKKSRKSAGATKVKDDDEDDEAEPEPITTKKSRSTKAAADSKVPVKPARRLSSKARVEPEPQELDEEEMAAPKATARRGKPRKSN